MAKKIKRKAAEEEIKETEVAEEKPATEVTEEIAEVEDKKEDKAEENKEKTEEVAEVITLDSGAVVDENAQPSEEEAENLVKITKEDGTELFVEKVEDADSDEEKKAIYEAIVEADNADEAEETAEEVIDAIDNGDEIEEMHYVPAACHSVAASLNKSFVVCKLKSGKYKALQAGKIYPAKLKAAMIKQIKAGKEDEIPHIQTIMSKIASKIGYTFSAFKKLAARNVKESKKEIRMKIKAYLQKKAALKKSAADNAETAQKEQLEKSSLEVSEVKPNDYETTVAVEDGEKVVKEDLPEVKTSKSKVHQFYGRLPNKAGVGENVQWALKDFNEKRNKTVASQIKSLRASIDMVKQLKEEKAELVKQNEALKTQLAKVEASKKQAAKAVKVNKIIAAMNITDELVKRNMQTKLASYDDSQLNAVLSCYSLDPEIDTVLMNERKIEEMKKEASVYVPQVTLGEDSLTFENETDYVALLKQREMNKNK